MNLIVNGDAEGGGPGSTDGSDVPIPGWTVTAPDPGPTRVQYGAFDTSGLAFPTTSDTIPPEAGTSFFAGGPDRDFAAATQEVSLADYVEAITAGTARFTLDAWLGGYEDQEDNAYVGVQLVTTGDPADAVTYTLERVTSEHRGGNTGFVHRLVSGPIPTGNRPDPYANVVIEFTRAAGSYNDAYIDNISLTVTTD